MAASRPSISARGPMRMSRKRRRGEVFEDMSWRVQGERCGVGVHYSTGRGRHCVARALAYRRTLVLPFARMNILVIDSDRVSRRLAALLLARLGCPPPVLIDDAASLPAGDWSLVLVGEHIAAPSLRDALGAHTRLVIMAAQDSDETHRAGLQAGADEMLVKPLALQDLADVLARTGPRSGDFNIAVWHEMVELFDAAGVALLAGALFDIGGASFGARGC